ncbi:hypothetical protein NW754_005049 [Fusarium falciforme]|nr:hypothetical protein NW754_005049 [Fusarium falciforme]
MSREQGQGEFLAGYQKQFDDGDDKRKLSLRVAIELLSGRIEQLCNFIGENSLEPPPMPKEEQEALIKVLGHLKLTHTFASKDAARAPSNGTASPRQSPGQNQPNANAAIESLPPPPAPLPVWDRVDDSAQVAVITQP